MKYPLVIWALKNIKSFRPNSIPIKLLKILDPRISFDVAILIDKSFEIGIFPDMQWITKVTPVVKKGLKILIVDQSPYSLYVTNWLKNQCMNALYNFLNLWSTILYAIWFSKWSFNWLYAFN